MAEVPPATNRGLAFEDVEFELRAQDVSQVRSLAVVLRAQREVLDQIATGAPIATALDAVARMIETSTCDTTVAIYLQRDDAIELAAAPSVPPGFAAAAASVIAPPGSLVPGAIEPLAGALAEIAEDNGLGFGWWLSVVDESGCDIGRVVLLAGEKRFLTAEERTQCDEAARLISVAAGTARAVRHAVDANDRDITTGLLNRSALLRAIEPGPANRDADGAVMLLVEVRTLAACNAELGFAGGDAMLLAIAERLRHVARGRDLLARWSGSRFLVLGCSRSASNATSGFASRIEAAVAGPIAVNGTTFDPDPRVTAIVRAHGETPARALIRLEQAALGARGSSGPCAASCSGRAADGR